MIKKLLEEKNIFNLLRELIITGLLSNMEASWSFKNQPLEFPWHEMGESGPAGMGFCLVLKSLGSVLSVMETVPSMFRLVVNFCVRD